MKGVSAVMDGMTDKQFCCFLRFIRDDIVEVLEKLPESPERKKLQKIADNMQKSIEE